MKAIANMETTLYDVRRRPRIYISADGENTIYTWDGHAVARIDGEHVFGWRGRHIGWFVEGILYDTKGFRIGFTAETFADPTFPEPGKYAKYRTSPPHAQQAVQDRPEFSFGNSNEDLDTFMRQNGP